MDAARIAALLQPFLDQPLPAPALDQISIYIDLLLRWNTRINLTAIRTPEEIVTRHFGESFFLASHLFPERAEPAGLSPSTGTGTPPISPVAVSGAQSHTPRVLDLGSGAGFPALPIKIWFPAIRLTLVESNHKKAAFLREAVRHLTLMDVNVSPERAEALAGRNPPQAEVVTLRAVEHFDAILPVAVKFLAPAARLALLIGSSQLPALPRLAPTLDWQSPISIPESQSRVLAVGVNRS